MEKLYYYIVLGIIYLGFQAYKKYKENEAKQAKSTPAQQKPIVQEFKGPETSKKALENRPKPLLSNPTKSTRPAPMYIPGKTPPVSLEDLIKQFDKAGQEQTPKNVEKYEDNYVEKPVMLVDKYVDEEEIARQRVQADRNAAMKQNKEGMLIKEEDFAPYAQEVVKESEYIKLLRSSEGAKNAFVLSEIFNRKFE